MTLRPPLDPVQDNRWEVTRGITTTAERRKEDGLREEKQQPPIEDRRIGDDVVVKRGQGSGAGISTSSGNVVQSRDVEFEDVVENREIGVVRDDLRKLRGSQSRGWNGHERRNRDVIMIRVGRLRWRAGKPRGGTGRRRLG